MSKIDLVRGEPSLLELFRALRSSSEAQRTLLLFSRFARRFSSTAEGKVKSFKSSQIIQIFLFVRFVQICWISAPFGALLYFSRLSARNLSNLSKSSKSFYLFDLFRFVVFLPRLGHSYISVACRREIFQIFPNHPNLFFLYLFRFVGFLPRQGHSYFSLSITTYQCS